MIVSIDEIRHRARRTLPAWLFDYVDGGSYSESSVRRNRDALTEVRFVPRVLRGVSAPDTTCTLLGAPQTFPVIAAPVGMGGMLAPAGEISLARAARHAGIQACFSHFSIASLEEIARETDPARMLFQLYMFRDRDITRHTVLRARDAGIRSLVVTVDTPVTPLRERDVRNGFRSLSRLSARHVLQMATRPGWTARMARAGTPVMGNLTPCDMGNTLFAQAARIPHNLDPDITWADLAWLRELWPGRLIVKGILHPDDIPEALRIGADGVVLSNHGGRQLDGAVSGFDTLDACAAIAGNRLELLVDGGFRYGADIVRALARGASGVMIGRPWAWGLAADGEQGVTDVLDYFLQGMRSTMTLLGAGTIRSLCAGQNHLSENPAKQTVAPVTSHRMEESL